MKKSILQFGLAAVFAFFCVPVGGAIPVPELTADADESPGLIWGTDLDEAAGRAQHSLRPVLVLFTGERCAACYRLKSGPLENPELQSLLRKFERVEIDANRRSELAMQYQVRGIPAFRILAPDGRVKGELNGYRSSSEIRACLNDVLNEKSAPTIAPLLDQLKSGEAGADVWQEALLCMSENDGRQTLRGLVDHLTTNDRRHIVMNLTNSQLSVRSGAIDYLEELAGGSLGFDPWEPMESYRQTEALAQWQAWAESTNTTQVIYAALTQEQFDRYLQDLISDNRARSKYALQVLSNGGQTVLHGFVKFLESDPALSDGALRRIKEVQYSLVIPETATISPLSCAHRIIWGNQDVRLQTIRQLADSGTAIMPVLIDLLQSPDPLVREVTVEAAFAAAGRLAVKPFQEHLERETDVDVIYTILKQLGDIKTRRSLQTLETYFTHENEDLAIISIQGAVKVSGTSLTTKLIPLLEDPRWRVRVAALEGLGEEKQSGDNTVLSKVFTRCLDDPDEFVRHTAVAVVVKKKLSGMGVPLNKAYAKHPDMRAVILSALFAMNAALPVSFEKDLFGDSSDDLLYVLDSLESLNRESRKILHRAAGSKDNDVSCTALRKLAETSSRNRGDNGILRDALVEGTPEQKLTVIQEFDVDYRAQDKLRLAMGKRTSGASVASNKAGKKSSTVVSRLYEELLRRDPGSAQQPTGSSASAATDEDVLVEMERIMNDAESSELLRHNAMIQLVNFGLRDALILAESEWTQLTQTDRSAIVSGLSHFKQDAVPVLKLALNDLNTDEWEQVIYGIGNVGSSEIYDIVLNKAAEVDSQVSCSMLWAMGLYNLDEHEVAPALGSIKRVLKNHTSQKAEMVILSLSLLAKTGRSQIELNDFIHHENEFIRREAWAALAAVNNAAFSARLQEIHDDDSWYVRSLVAEWYYYYRYSSRKIDIYFSEDECCSGYESLRLDRNNGSSRVAVSNEEVGNTLRNLAENDVHAWVRYRAMLTLLSNRIPVDLNKVVAAGVESKRSDDAAKLMGEFLRENDDALGKSFSAVFPLLRVPGNKTYATSTMDKLKTRWEMSEQDHIAAGPSFEFAESKKNLEPVMATFSSFSGDWSRARRSRPLEVVYFTTPGCKECKDAQRELHRVSGRSHSLIIRSFNIRTPEGLRYNEALCEKFGVQRKYRGVSPAIFMIGGHLIKDDISKMAIMNLAERSSLELEDDEWANVNTKTLEAAVDVIEARAESYTIPLILWAGLIDGVNPCAFATIIFLLSYLKVRKRRGREMLQIGFAYVGAVFTTYLLLGFGLAAVISKLTVLDSIGRLVNALMALAMFLVALISFRDGIKCLKGKAKEMTLQLSDKAKQNIHAVIRKGTASKRYILAAIILGIVVSVLELACTGQVYAPTIMYMIQSGMAQFKGTIMLILYNVAFVVPLVIVFMISARGADNMKLQNFMMRHMALAKFMLASLFGTMFVLFLKYAM